MSTISTSWGGEKVSFHKENDHNFYQYKDGNTSEIHLEFKGENDKELIHLIQDVRKLDKFKKKYIVIHDNIHFRRYDKDVSEVDYTFEEMVDLSYCIFKKNVRFQACYFKKGVNLSESTFEGKARFHESQFEDFSYFQNTSFKQLVDFYHAKFYKNQIFHLTDFLDRAIFSNVIFKGKTKFLYNKVGGSNTFISFENATFEQSVDVSRANFWCNIQFWGVKIPEIIPNNFEEYVGHNAFKEEGKESNGYPIEKEENVENEENTKAQSKENVVENKTTNTKQNEDKTINKPTRTTREISQKEKKCLNKINALKHIRESYRRIKQEFRKEGNVIEALEFQKHEMKLYAKELSVKGFWEKWPDKIILWLNKVSNNHGTSWGRGFLFTMGTTLFFYLTMLLIICRSNDYTVVYGLEYTGTWFQYYLQFFNITLWSYEPFEIDTNSPVYPYIYIILFIGRLFIGYGYYQTIQAFRRYGKN